MLIQRAAMEDNENLSLAPYGFRSSASRGRLHPEPEAQDRTCFQRDRARVLHTTAFRRLEYKTQVFVNSEGDYYRTRLTHTLEVAQLGRSIARSLGANEDLVEAICLAHDLGHPPFGHAGERVLQRLMAAHGHFDHNRQTLRIVTTLEERYEDFRGLNLTWEMREGIVKHETEYDRADAGEYNPELRASLEAQIANVADELAYTAHDLDDGLRAGLLLPAGLGSQALWETVRADINWDGREWKDLIRHRMIRRLIGLQIQDLIATTVAALQQPGASSSLHIQQLSTNVVDWSAGMQAMQTELKSHLRERLFQHHRVARMAEKAERFITEMFEVFTKSPHQLPGGVKNAIAEYGLERAVCDYIAGMTDRFALDEYARLFDPHTRP